MRPKMTLNLKAVLSGLAMFVFAQYLLSAVLILVSLTGAISLESHAAMYAARMVTSLLAWTWTCYLVLDLVEDTNWEFGVLLVFFYYWVQMLTSYAMTGALQFSGQITFEVGFAFIGVLCGAMFRLTAKEMKQVEHRFLVHA